MPYVYPPAPAVHGVAAGDAAEDILTADGMSIQQKLDELEGEIDLLKKEKLILEFTE